MGAGEVVGPDPRRQPEDRGVGERHRFGLILEGRHRQHRPEDLVLGEVRLWINVGEDGRGDVGPAGFLQDPLPAADQSRAVAVGTVNLAEHRLALRFGGNRAGLGRQIERIADHHGFRFSLERVEEGLVDAALDQQAGPGDTDLAAVAEDRRSRDLGRLGQIAGVVKDDVRGLATQFQIDALEIGARRVFEQAPPGAARAGEHHDVDVAVQAHGLTDDPAFAGDNVEHAVGQARLVAQLGQPHQAQRGNLRRFDHDRVACGQRRGDFPRTDHQREVPGDDGADHADWLAVDQPQRPLGRGRDLAADLVRGLGVVAEGARCAARLGAQGHGDLSAVVAHAEDGEFEAVGLDQVGAAVQDTLARSRGHARPAPIVEGLAGCSNSRIDVERRTPRQRAECRAVDGRGILSRFTAGGRDLLPPDQVFGFGKCGSPQGINITLLDHAGILGTGAEGPQASVTMSHR